MGQDDQPSQPERTDFFVSYVSSNQDWAEWLGTQLEQAGYTAFVEAWDVRPGDNRVLALNQGLQRAERVLVVLSPAYFQMEMVQTQWAAALLKDQTGTHRRVLPVLIETCDVDGLLRGLVCIDLVGGDEQAARTRLLEGIQTGRTRPASVAFPARQGTGAAFPGRSLMWTIPFARNPYFTGREEQLQVLREQLQAQRSAAIGQIQAMSGLGGIGKTQMAVEYAYRHREEYAQVFWVRADTVETLASSYGELARLLDLPEENAQEQAVMIQAVNRWLREHRDYLLILDNADAPALLPPFLPPDPAGHVLITTRAADLSELDLGLADPLALDALPPGQGVSFLLRRAGVLAQTTEEERSLALQLVEELGGLPLALDQAGAYLRKTRSSLAGYLHLYQQQRARLLKEHQSRNYPASVATTWTLSFQRVEEQNPAAADLLRFCAFLAPDAIPEAILTQGAPELGSVLVADPLQLNDAIAVLRAYSLVERDAQDGALSIHRLVQTVLRDSLPTRKQKQWMRRAVLAVEAAHPGWSFDAWSALERWLPHAQICATWIQQIPLITQTAARLLNQAGVSLYERGRYGEAEPLLQRALAIREQELGASHPDTAASLNNLAGLYHGQGRYEEAELLLQRALAIREQELGASHPATATSLNNLAGLYRAQGRYGEAEPLYQRALAIREQELGASHPATATSLNNLAGLYRAQGRYGEAEPLLQRALAISLRVLGQEHPTTQLFGENYAGLRQVMEQEERDGE